MSFTNTVLLLWRTMLSILGISYLKSSLELSHDSCTQWHMVIALPSSHNIYEIVWINVVKLYWFGFSPFNSQRPSWSWSYASCIYNYMYNQCLSALNLWVRIQLMAVWLATDRWYSSGTLVSSPIKLTSTISVKYCWKWR